MNRSVKTGGSKDRTLVVPDVTGLSNREAAHIYLDAGLMPHPWRVSRGTKVSALKGFKFHEFDITHEDISRWQNGWRCGLTTSKASGLIVVDVDVPEEFRAWTEDGGPKFPRTAQSQTGRDGGFHLVYDARDLADEDWPVQGDIPGGQVKSNGFIAVEPSYHPNHKPYLWHTYNIAPIGSVANALREYQPTRDRREVFGIDIDELMADGIEPGEQHKVLKSMLYKLRLDGMSRDSAYMIWKTILARSVTGIDASGNRKPSFAKADFDADWNGADQKITALEKELPRGKGIKVNDDAYAIRTGDWLDAQKFPELTFAVPSIIVEGMTLIVGRPKVGKSILILRFGLECGRGGVVFGEECDKRDVLYLALEDGNRRMQKRCWQLLAGDPIPPDFTYQLKVKPGKLLKVIRSWLAEHPGGLVLVDTLGKVLEPGKGNETTYERDYRIVAAIKEVADDHPGSAIVVSHHARKASADDWLDTVSGTTGITGAADTVIILTRKRAGQDGMLKITGRDVDEAEYALIKEMPTGWRLNGADLLESAGNAASEQSKRGSSSQSILDFINDLDKDETVTNAQIVNATGLPSGRVKVHLHNLTRDGLITRVRPGVYGKAGRQKISKD